MGVSIEIFAWLAKICILKEIKSEFTFTHLKEGKDALAFKSSNFLRLI